MAWLRSPFVLGKSPRRRRPKMVGPDTMTSTVKTKHSRGLSSTSDDPSPLDSASQRRVSRDSDSTTSATSMFCSPAPSGVDASRPGAVSRFSESTASSNTPLPFDSSSEPSTGITTPSAEDPSKADFGNSSLVLQETTESSSPIPVSGPREGCSHREMAFTNGSGLVCTVCGSWGLESVFACIDAPQKGKRRAQQPGNKTNGVTPSKPARKQPETREPSRPDLPFVKSMTQEELEKYSTEELMKMIIEYKPEYAESRCQLHSAIIAVRSAVAQRTTSAKGGHLRESTDLTRSSMCSTLSWLPAPDKARCQFSVCTECASKDTDRVYLGWGSINTQGKARAVPAIDGKLPRPRPIPSSAVRQPRKVSRKMVEIRWSEGGPMVSLWDLDVYYHGLTGDGWRVPKWTRPRNMLRTPARLKSESREGSTAPSNPSRPMPRGRSVSHAEAHGVWQ